MRTLEWIEQWYLDQCDGDWEHNYAIKIETLDNPGWQITIDLKYTQIEDLNQEWDLVEKNENDWYRIKIKDSVFSAAGDPRKLEFLFDKFREIPEKE